MTTHSGSFAWEMSWAEEPGRQQSMRFQRVRHDTTTTTVIKYHANSTYYNSKVTFIVISLA